jgi:hypothetical protein
MLQARLAKHNALVMGDEFHRKTGDIDNNEIALNSEDENRQAQVSQIAPLHRGEDSR